MNYSNIVGKFFDVNDVFFGKIESEQEAERLVNKAIKKGGVPFLKRIKICKNQRTFTSRSYGVGISVFEYLKSNHIVSK